MSVSGQPHRDDLQGRLSAPRPINILTPKNILSGVIHRFSCVRVRVCCPVSQTPTPEQHSIMTNSFHCKWALRAIGANLLPSLHLTFVNIRAFIFIGYDLGDDFTMPRGRLGMLSDFLNVHVRLQLQKHVLMEIVHTPSTPNFFLEFTSKSKALSLVSHPPSQPGSS